MTIRKVVASVVAVVIFAAPVAASAKTAPVPPEVIAGIYIAKELTKPKPFCKILKVFNRKKRC